ncbi:MAG: hypothetical protein U0704_16185 [Candidatus Eisenbacteria bacterium]
MGALRTRLAAIAAAALLAAGCVNPFEPAKPEAPTGISVVPNFTSPEKLLDTIQDAISAEADGALAYGDALADSVSESTPFGFYATPDPLALSTWRQGSGRDPYDVGDVRHERLFFSDLLTVLDSFDYVFQWVDDPDSPLPSTDLVNGTALFHRYYVLVASSGSIQETIAIGYADLYMRKHNGRWWLVRWDDRIDPTIGVNPANLNNRSMGWRRLDL